MSLSFQKQQIKVFFQFFVFVVISGLRGVFRASGFRGFEEGRGAGEDKDGKWPLG